MGEVKGEFNHIECIIYKIHRHTHIYIYNESKTTEVSVAISHFLLLIFIAV